MSEIDEGGDRAELVVRKSFLSRRLYSLFSVVFDGCVATFYIVGSSQYILSLL